MKAWDRGAPLEGDLQVCAFSGNIWLCFFFFLYQCPVSKYDWFCHQTDTTLGCSQLPSQHPHTLDVNLHRYSRRFAVAPSVLYPQRHS